MSRGAPDPKAALSFCRYAVAGGRYHEASISRGGYAIVVGRDAHPHGRRCTRVALGSAD